MAACGARATLTFSSSLGDVQARLRALPASIRVRGAEALTKAALRVLYRANNEFVPREDDDLSGAAVVDAPIFEPGGNVAVTMAYGRSGPSAAYALAVHEHLSAHSPPTWIEAEKAGRGVHFRVGGPKYLEIPFREESSNLPTVLAAARVVD